MNPERVKELALEAGFDLAGIAPAAAPAPLGAFARWIAAGHAGEMAYLTQQVERRSDLRAAFPWARSVVCVGLQYDTPAPYSTTRDEGGWIARYAWGDDYHDVMGRMLERLERALVDEMGPFRCRRWVDTGPIVERAKGAKLVHAADGTAARDRQPDLRGTRGRRRRPGAGGVQ